MYILSCIQVKSPCVLFLYLAEQELLRLQQEYRIMEGDRKAYSEESQNIIRKQKAAITSLQAENEELMKDNHLAGSQQNESKVKILFLGHYITVKKKDDKKIIFKC